MRDDDQRDPEIARLENELETVRYNLIGLAAKLVPDELGHALIRGHFDCETQAQFLNWERDTIDKIIAAAERDDKGRALCPLCKEGRERWGWGDGGESGWALPSGLQTHLLGEGRTTQCPVFDAALKLANDRMRPKIEKEEQRKREAREARRQTERVFLIDPTKPPELIDDIRSWHEHRGAEQLEWAEARLRTLGFEFDLNGNVMAYRLPHPEFVILADPREQKKIMVRIFAGEGKPRLKTSYHRNTGQRHEEFELRDHWTRDLPARFKDMVEDGCNKLRDRLPKQKASRSAPVRSRLPL